MIIQMFVIFAAQKENNMPKPYTKHQKKRSNKIIRKDLGNPSDHKHNQFIQLIKLQAMMAANGYNKSTI